MHFYTLFSVVLSRFPNIMNRLPTIYAQMMHSMQKASMHIYTIPLIRFLYIVLPPVQLVVPVHNLELISPEIERVKA